MSIGVHKILMQFLEVKNNEQILLQISLNIPKK